MSYDHCSQCGAFLGPNEYRVCDACLREAKERAEQEGKQGVSRGPILICLRVAPGEFRVPGSTIHQCSECAADVSVSPASRPILSGPGAVILCLECAAGRLLKSGERAQVAAPTPAQVQELLPWLRRNN